MSVSARRMRTQSWGQCLSVSRTRAPFESYSKHEFVYHHRQPSTRVIKMSVTSQRLSTTKDYQELLDKYDTWLFDCDGVLWRGTTLIDGAKEFLQLLRSKSQSPFLIAASRLFVIWLLLRIKKEKDVIFVTNNATNSRASYKTKFDKLGIEAHVVRPWHIHFQINTLFIYRKRI